MSRRSKRMARKWWAYTRKLPDDSHISDKLVQYVARNVGVGFNDRYYSSSYSAKPACTPQSAQHMKGITSGRGS